MSDPLERGRQRKNGATCASWSWFDRPLAASPRVACVRRRQAGDMAPDAVTGVTIRPSLHEVVHDWYLCGHPSSDRGTVPPSDFTHVVA